MSYILKALKLSEEERTKGKVPNLTTRHRRSSLHPRRRVWPWVVGGAAAVCLLLVLFATWPTQISSSTDVTDLEQGLELKPKVKPAPPQVAVLPAPRDPRLQTVDGLSQPDTTAGGQPIDIASSLNPAPVQQATLTDESNRNWLDEEDTLAPVAKPQAAAPQPSSTVPAAKPRNGSALLETLSATDFTQQALMDWAEDAVLTEDPILEGPEVQVALADPIEAIPQEEEELETAAPVIDAYPDVPPLWQLPHAIRSQVPEVTLAVHVFAPDDSSRFVIINRKRYREGDVVEGRLRLEAIIPSGVVLGYDSHRFKLGSQ